MNSIQFTPNTHKQKRKNRRKNVEIRELKCTSSKLFLKCHQLIAIYLLVLKSFVLEWICYDYISMLLFQYMYVCRLIHSVSQPNSGHGNSCHLAFSQIDLYSFFFFWNLKQANRMKQNSAHFTRFKLDSILPQKKTMTQQWNFKGKPIFVWLIDLIIIIITTTFLC